MNRKRKYLSLSILIAFFFSTGLCANGYFSLDLGLTFFGNTISSSEVLGSTPHPLFYGGGISFPIYLNSSLYLKPALFITATNYLYDGTRALPAASEHREFLVLFSNLDLLIGFKLPLTTKMVLEINIGPSAVLRWPIVLSDQASGDSAAILEYFFSRLRYLYPAAEIALKWDIEDNFGLIFASKARLPLFHLWDGEGASWLDQLMISGTVGFVINTH